VLRKASVSYNTVWRVEALDAFKASVITNLLERPRVLARAADPTVQIAGNLRR